MLKRDELRTVTATITTTEGNVGSAVPQNMRRFIYKIKATNEHAIANLLTLGKRENGVLVTTVIDRIRWATQYEIWNDPDELEEDATPLYIVEGAGAAGTSFLRAVTSLMTAGIGAYLTIWYVDAPA